MTAERLGAVVLAGGRSSRFGTDKMRALIDGRPLLDRSIAAVRSVASTVVVVLAPGATRDLPAHVIVASDAQAFEGPLAGLAAGLAAMPPHIERVLVVGGDMPTLSTPVLALLLDALGPSGGIDHAAAAILDEGGRRDGHPRVAGCRRAAAAGPPGAP
jgi:molybdopterin-guanine dinucleotide biosynthesis protein A